MPHIHEKIDFCSEVFIVNDGKILLRKHDKFRKWMSVGGHVELDEDPAQAAVREVKEEVGLDVKLFDDYEPKLEILDDTTRVIAPRFINRHRINETHEHVAMVYFATTDNPNVVVPEDSHESVHEEEWDWFTKEQVKTLEDCPQNVKQYAMAAIDEISS